MRWTLSSTRSPVPDSASAENRTVYRLELPIPARLQSTGGQSDILGALAATLEAQREPIQIRFVPARCETSDVDGSGAASALLRALARDATPWVVEIHAKDLEPLNGAIALTPADRAVDLPTPTAESRTQLQLDDGQIGRVLALTRWPSVVPLGWTTDLATIPGVRGLALHLRPVDRAAGQRLLRRRLATLASTATVDAEAGRVPDATLRVASEAAEALWERLVRGDTALWSAQVLLLVAADDSQDLNEATAEVERHLGGYAAEVVAPALQQLPALRGMAPSGQPLSWPWRLLDTAAVAATVPHPRGHTDAGSGVLVGVEPDAHSPVRVDRFGLHNPTRLVVGTSGAGKSYAAKLELMRWLVAGAQAVVVDPEGEFGVLGDTLAGLSLAVGDEPAGLDPVGLACSPALADAEGLSVLSSVAAALLGTPLGTVDLALVDRALQVLRADATGVVGMRDLVDVIGDIAAHPPFTGTDLAARLAPATAGSLAGLFAPNPDLADPPGLVVFDLQAVPSRARPAVMACVLAWSWSRARHTPADHAVAIPRLLVVDEAHLLLDDPPAAELLAQFARRARKYGVGLDVVTQRLSDFLGHPTGEAVLANAATKLLLGCEDRERDAVAVGLGLTDAEADLLRPGRRGHGLLLTPERRTPVEIVAASAEHELASAGPRLR